MTKSGATKSASKARSKKRSAQPAKRNNPAFRQISAYLRIETHDEAAIKLRRENRTKDKDERRDFSELLEDLLGSWIVG